jgi:histidinol phosphatase-like enzyme
MITEQQVKELENLLSNKKSLEKDISRLENTEFDNSVYLLHHHKESSCAYENKLYIPGKLRKPLVQLVLEYLREQLVQTTTRLENLQVVRNDIENKIID